MCSFLERLFLSLSEFGGLVSPPSHLSMLACLIGGVLVQACLDSHVGGMSWVHTSKNTLLINSASLNWYI